MGTTWDLFIACNARVGCMVTIAHIFYFATCLLFIKHASDPSCQLTLVT